MGVFQVSLPFQSLKLVFDAVFLVLVELSCDCGGRWLGYPFRSCPTLFSTRLPVVPRITSQETTYLLVLAICNIV